MRVLLVRPKSRTLVHAPLGFLHLASALEARGHSVSILDGMTTRVTPDSTAVLASKSGAGAVGFGGMSCEYPENREFAAALRARLPDVRVVFGGPHATGNPQLCLRDCADYVVTGEGEITFPRLLDALTAGRPPQRIW